MKMRVVLVCLLGLCLPACDDEEARIPPVGPDIHGSWHGTYSGTGADQAITAKVTQQGEAVTIVTSKSTPYGQRLSGTIDETGYLTLTDASNGETWTTYHTHATANHIRISDFDEAPTPLDPQPGLNVIDLVR